MIYYATSNNISAISWWSVLLAEETVVPGENHQPAASHWQGENTSSYSFNGYLTLMFVGPS
jgi:hypothetical protein